GAVALPGGRRLLSLLSRPGSWVGAAALIVALALTIPWVGAWYSWRTAQGAMGRHRPREARPYLNQCLHVWPESSEVHLLAARAARLLDDYSTAEQHLLEC